MHPMFVQLFLSGDADDPSAEEEERRRARRAKRHRTAVVTRVASRAPAGRTRPGGSAA
jgi:hypothetical protein